MPEADFFQRLGVFAIKEFLDVDLCNNLQAEMRLSKSVSPASVTNAEGLDRVDEDTRRTKLVEVSKNLKNSVKQHLAAIKPKIEAHFGVALDECESSQFLAYKEGDFFKPHTDSSTSTTSHNYIQQRRVSVVIFLNGESASANQNSYSGGSLILYGLLDNASWKDYGFNIKGEPGLLIAFASDVYHEVTPVTKGMRFTMVTWFPSSVPP
jgi:SM-20-related protein